MGRTVNPLASVYGGSNPPLPSPRIRAGPAEGNRRVAYVLQRIRVVMEIIT